MAASSPVALVGKPSAWSILLSILLIFAGILAIALPLAAGLAVNIVVAWLLIFCGVVHLIFAWFRPGAGGFIWQLLLAILYVFIGVYMLLHPTFGMESLALALAIYLLLESILEFILGFAMRPARGSGWLFLDAVVTLILAVMIWKLWPSGSAWVLGTLVGISMLFGGTVRLIFSMTARSVAARLA